jgi:uncharacterized protein
MENRPFTDHSYEQFLSEKRIMGTRCRKCGSLALPPRVVCSSCHSMDLEWIEFQGEGRLAAFTSIYIPPPFMALEGFGRKKPYVSGVVELKEGPRVVARIIGVDAGKPEKIKIGMAVKADFLEKREGGGRISALAFRPS